MGIENVQTSAGAVIAISASTPATLDDDATGGFPSLTYTTIGEVTDGGTIGGTYGEATHVPLDTRLVQSLKTSFDAGNQTLQLAVYPDDAGQTIALDNLHVDAAVSISVTLQDGSVIYYLAQVRSFPINIGTVDTIVNTSIELRINSYPVFVWPTP